MTGRRYDDEEVAAIFRAAAEGGESRALSAGNAEGLTLSDLQASAREVGISPDAVTGAAQTLDRAGTPASPRPFLGLPIAVERVVPLPRGLTTHEWELLVVELRQVFEARGRLREQGSLREWSNGNLHVLLEPTPTGHQLRLGTTKGNSRLHITAGAVMVGISAVYGAIGLMGHAGAWADVLPLGAMGAALLGLGTLRLPSWARRRRQQFDSIAERLTRTIQYPDAAPSLPHGET